MLTYIETEFYARRRIEKNCTNAFISYKNSYFSLNNFIVEIQNGSSDNTEILNFLDFVV